MTFVKHTALCIAGILAWIVLFLLILAVENIIYALGIDSNTISMLLLLIPFIIHLSLIFFYYRRGHSLFALPLGHFLFPVMLIIVLVEGS